MKVIKQDQVMEDLFLYYFSWTVCHLFKKTERDGSCRQLHLFIFISVYQKTNCDRSLAEGITDTVYRDQTVTVCGRRAYLHHLHRK